MGQTKKIITFGEKQIVLIGTAHVSKESCDEVAREIRGELPSCVAIELDEQRYASLKNPDSWKELDIIKVLKEKKGFLLLANLVLASFQRRMGVNIGVKPGDEMRAGIDVAEELGIGTVMVDRPIQTTLRRAWAKTGGMGRIKLLSALISSAFDTEEISTEQIENLKKSNEMDGMMAELSEFLPAVKEVLIDERDFYLAAHIWKASEGKEKTLAVLGAGHLPGVEKHLALLADGKETPDTAQISSLPKKKPLSKIISWGIPALIIALIAAGFVWGGMSKGADLLGSWLLWNGILAGIGALIALAHPLALLVSIVGAPFTSLCPFVGIGLLAGFVQAVVKKPKVSDIERLQDDVASVKGFYKNRILHVLLVFFLSSLGSSIGTFVAGSSMVVNLTQFLKELF
ncbi:MAG: TraB/GumN family protein [Treponema sp.]|nr:TraB/GumN family protein [Treponema sp.]